MKRHGQGFENDLEEGQVRCDYVRVRDWSINRRMDRGNWKRSKYNTLKFASMHYIESTSSSSSPNLRVGANVMGHFGSKAKRVKVKWKMGQMERPKINRNEEKVCGLGRRSSHKA